MKHFYDMTNKNCNNNNTKVVNQTQQFIFFQREIKQKIKEKKGNKIVHESMLVHWCGVDSLLLLYYYNYTIIIVIHVYNITYMLIMRKQQSM